jgi:hypothetical protein
MLKFLFGVVVGIVVATIGFTGIAAMADRGVAKVQEISKDAVKSSTAEEVKNTVDKAVTAVTK